MDLLSIYNEAKDQISFCRKKLYSLELILAKTTKDTSSVTSFLQTVYS